MGFAAETLDAERRLVSAGCHNAASLYDAAYTWGVCGSMFADPTCAAMCTVLLACASLGFPIKPDPLCERCPEPLRTVAAREGARVADLDRIVWIESTGAGVHNYARRVYEFYCRRLGAKHLIRQADELIRGALPRVDVFGPFAEALQRPVKETVWAA